MTTPRPEPKNSSPAGKPSGKGAQLLHYAQDLSRVYREKKRQQGELHATKSQLIKYATDLRSTVIDLKQTNRDLQEAYFDTIRRLVRASEYKDKDTGDHITRISRYSFFLAQLAGLGQETAERIYYASPMHDVGKIGIPDTILLKEGKLTDEEFDIMKNHTGIGANILANSSAPVLLMAEEIARTHHERWDGMGYPAGMSGTDIPVTGRIVGLVDTFDALTSRRPYKNPYPLDIACDIIHKGREHHFDPELVALFLDNIEEIVSIRQETGGACETTGSEYRLSERDGG